MYYVRRHCRSMSTAFGSITIYSMLHSIIYGSLYSISCSDGCGTSQCHFTSQASDARISGLSFRGLIAYCLTYIVSRIAICILVRITSILLVIPYLIGSHTVFLITSLVSSLEQFLKGSSMASSYFFWSLFIRTACSMSYIMPYHICHWMLYSIPYRLSTRISQSISYWSFHRILSSHTWQHIEYLRLLSQALEIFLKH